MSEFSRLPVRVKVTGARGRVGLDLVGTPLPGQYVVWDADRRVRGASGTGADAGLRTDLAAAAGSALVGYKSAFADAFVRSQASRNADQLSVFEFIPVALHASIIGRTLNNNIAQGRTLAGYIQKAIDAAATQRKRLYIPAGLYNIAPPASFAAEGGTCQRCFAIRSYMDIDAEFGATFRIVDGVSTDAAPVFMCMFGTNEVLGRVTWRGVEMDMNAAGNPISPNRIKNRAGTIATTSGSDIVTGTGTNFTTYLTTGAVSQLIEIAGDFLPVAQVISDTSIRLVAPIRATLTGQAVRAGNYTTLNQAQIFVSGTPGGVLARINNAVVEYCRFINNPGVSCIVLAQTNVVNSGIGDQWLIQFNDFRNNGTDSTDHSSVYGWCENVRCFSNNFENDVAYGPTGGCVAYEVHGDSTMFAYNVIRRYFQICWIDGNGSRFTGKTSVHHNIGAGMTAYGIMFFGQVAVENPVYDTAIHDNHITFDDSKIEPVVLKIGIGCSAPYQQIGATISRNTVRASGTTVAVAGIAINAGPIVGQRHDRFVIEDNDLVGTAIGVALITNATVGLGNMIVRNNRSWNLTPAGIVTLPQGVSISATGAQIDDLTIENNKCFDDRGSSAACAFGVRVEGAVGRYMASGNISRGMTQADYAESSFFAASRVGRFTSSTPYDPPSIAAAQSVATTVIVPGASVGDKTTCSLNTTLSGVMMSSYISSANTATVVLFNPTAAAIDLPSGTLSVTLEKQP